MASLTNATLRRAVETILNTLSKHEGTFETALNENEMILLAKRFSEVCNKEPMMISLSGKFVVVGDLHGDIGSLVRIFNKFGYPPNTSYILLGDYVDRGSNSCEVIIMLFALKILYPMNIFMLRGNHECESMTETNGFKTECLKKYSMATYTAITNSFNFLSIAIELNFRILCVHGGISPLLNSLDDIKSIKKPLKEPFTDMINDILWSDPTDTVEEYAESYRNIGNLYGYEATSKFLEKINLMFLIRSHEMCPYGYEYPFNERGKALTIFSSIDYCGNDNSGAAALIDETSLKVVELEPLSIEDQKKIRIIYPEFILKSQTSVTSHTAAKNTSKLGIESLSDDLIEDEALMAIVG